jgi:hypothetical protein
MIIRIIRIENSIPLNGFPDKNASIATESMGTQINSPNNLLVGSHLKIKAAINA